MLRFPTGARRCGRIAGLFLFGLVGVGCAPPQVLEIPATSYVEVNAGTGYWARRTSSYPSPIATAPVEVFVASRDSVRQAVTKASGATVYRRGHAMHLDPAFLARTLEDLGRHAVIGGPGRRVIWLGRFVRNFGRSLLIRILDYAEATGADALVDLQVFHNGWFGSPQRRPTNTLSEGGRCWVVSARLACYRDR